MVYHPRDEWNNKLSRIFDEHSHKFIFSEKMQKCKIFLIFGRIFLVFFSSTIAFVSAIFIFVPLFVDFCFLPDILYIWISTTLGMRMGNFWCGISGSYSALVLKRQIVEIGYKYSGIRRFSGFFGFPCLWSQMHGNSIDGCL